MGGKRYGKEELDLVVKMVKEGATVSAVQAAFVEKFGKERNTTGLKMLMRRARLVPPEAVEEKQVDGSSTG